MSDTTRPEISRDVIDAVDETLRESTGVPVDELGFEQKVRALLEGYETPDEGSSEPTIHAEVARRIQRLEGFVDELAKRVDDMEQRTSPEQDDAERYIRQKPGASRPSEDNDANQLDALIDDTQMRRR